MRNTLRAAAYELKTLVRKASARDSANSALVARIKKEKRLIFTVTNGRSGSLTLARLLDQIDGVAGLHEPAPSFHLIMRWAQGRPNLARKFWLQDKLPAIERDKEPIYVETSHLVCKGFIEPLLDIGLKPALTFLSRDPRKTAISMYRLNDIPGRTNRALKWYLSPEDVTCAHIPPAEIDRLSDYQLCYWHALETQARISHYMDVAAQKMLKVASVDIEDLNTWDGINALCDQLNIPINEASQTRLLKQIGNRENERSQEKRAVEISDAELEREEREVAALVSEATDNIRVASIGEVFRTYLTTAIRGL
ncbi:MAG: hypothetical protein RIC14_14650 [Filomicrobium sp.]